MDNVTLICNNCNIEKAIKEFRKDQYNNTGYTTSCNQCNAVKQRKYRKDNQVSYNSKALDYYHKNKDRINAMRRLRKNGVSTTTFHKIKDLNSYYHRNGWKKNKEKIWKERGILDMTYDRYEEMLCQQNNCCKICVKSTEIVGTLHVDHCHSTGKVRGLLCNNCNNGIGKLADSILLLQKAINYLQDANTTI